MSKDPIYENLREQTSEKIELKLPKKESRKQRVIKEFEEDSEARIIEYFMQKLHESQYSPINTSQFYVTKAIQSLSQIEDPENQGILEDLIDGHSSSTVH